MSVPTNPPASQLVTNPATVVWSDGTPFDGFLFLGLELPTNTSYAKFGLWGTLRAQDLPQYIKVPIIAGAIDQATQIYYNQYMTPPGSQYFAYWFTREGVLIAPASGTATGISVTIATTTLTVPTLTVPTYSGAAPPVPQT